MLEESGLVVSMQGDFARVSTSQQTACSSCAARKGCGTSLVASLFPRRERAFLAHNPVGARPGDRVVIGLDESALQIASLLLYLAPLLGLFIGAMLGLWLFPGQEGRAADLPAVTGGGIGLLLAFLVINRHAFGVLQRSRFRARILRVETASPGCIDNIEINLKT